MDAYYAAVDEAERIEARGMTSEQYNTRQALRELQESADVELMDKRLRVTPRTHG